MEINFKFMGDEFRKVDFVGKIAEKNKIAERTWEIVIKLDDTDFSFEPGQYIWVDLRGLKYDDSSGSRRAFSISSAPDAKGRVAIIFRESGSGYKKTLLEMPIGSEADIIGPFGSAFVLPAEAKHEDVYILSGGTGAAPFLSWLRNFAKTGFGSRHITLFNLNNSRAEAPFSDELEKISSEHKANFTLVQMFGRKFSWREAASYVKDLSGIWYVSGTQEAVNFFTGVLSGNGVKFSQMRFENFWPEHIGAETVELEARRHFKERILSDSQIAGKEPKEGIDKLRERFLAGFFIPAVILGIVMSGVMAGLLFYKGEKFLLHVFSIMILFASGVLWRFWKGGRGPLLKVLLINIVIILFFPLFAPGYSRNIVYWISSLPLLAFLLAGRKGKYWGGAFIAFLFLLTIFSGFDASVLKVGDWDMLQIFLSSVFLYGVACFYDAIRVRTLHAVSNQLEISNIFKEAVESSTNHIIITDFNGSILFANKAAQEMSGFKFSEMFMATPRLWGGLMDKDFYRDLWGKKAKGEKIVTEIVNRRKNFEKYNTIAHITPLKNEDGHIWGFLGTEEDITKIREAEKELVVSQARFLRMAETIDSVFWMLDLETKKRIFVSEAYEIIWGTKRDELYGNMEVWFNSIHQEDRKRVKDNFLKAVEDKKPYSITFRIVDNFGKVRHIKDSAYMVEEGPEAGKLMVGLAQDITKEEEIDLAKTEFVSLASHQLNAPLNSSRWYLEMLLEGDAGKLNKDQKRYLTGVYESNQRLIDLVSALLNVTRIEMGTFKIESENVDLKELCKSVVAELKPQISEKKTKIKESYGKDELEIPADKNLLRMILQNLLTNAIKYTPEKGKVDLQVTKLEAGEMIGGRQAEEKSVVIAVADNGYGIPINEKQMIFGKMFRASNVREKVKDGTGLGLYIVKRVVDASGGTIWFDSVEGKGTTFYVLLPASGMKKQEGSKSLT